MVIAGSPEISGVSQKSNVLFWLGKMHAGGASDVRFLQQRRRGLPRATLVGEGGMNGGNRRALAFAPLLGRAERPGRGRPRTRRCSGEVLLRRSSQGRRLFEPHASPAERVQDGFLPG